VTSDVSRRSSDAAWIPSPTARRALGFACVGGLVGVAASVGAYVEDAFDERFLFGGVQSIAEVPLLLAALHIARETSDVRPWRACVVMCFATWLGGGIRAVESGSGSHSALGLAVHLALLGAIAVIVVAARRADARPAPEGEPPALVLDGATPAATARLRIPWWLVAAFVAVDATETALLWTRRDQFEFATGALMTCAFVGGSTWWLVTKIQMRARLGTAAVVSAAADVLPVAAMLVAAAVVSELPDAALRTPAADAPAGVLLGLMIVVPTAVQTAWLWDLRSRATRALTARVG
jgi:hypothetical protein